MKLYQSGIKWYAKKDCNSRNKYGLKWLWTFRKILGTKIVVLKFIKPVNLEINYEEPENGITISLRENLVWICDSLENKEKNGEWNHRETLADYVPFGALNSLICY